MPLQVIVGPIIQAGQSLSDELDVSAGKMVRITTPNSWDPIAPVTFQISTDGQLYNDLFMPDGREVSIVCNGLNRAIVVPPAFGAAIAFIKFRSGTSLRPVKQNALRDFAVAIEI